jgi:hypothetical protein
MTTLLALVLAAVVIDESATCAQESDQVGETDWDYRPLQSSDLVVRGRVVGVSDGEILSSDFWSEPIRGKDVQRVGFVTLDVQEVLRGPAVTGNFRFMVHRDPVEVRAVFSVGTEMLICAYYHPRLEIYYQVRYASRYFRTADGWASGPTPLEERAFSDREVRQRVQETALETVAEHAELIVEGVVESVEESRIQGPDGSSGALVTLMLRVDVVKKGPMVGSPLRVVAITRGIYWPEWRKKVPKQYSVGQRWLCFLRLSDQGWYPFAGSDGFFQIVGEKLIYAERVEYWRTKSTVDRIVESLRDDESSNEQ